MEGYKKEIAAMRDKSQKVSSEIVQHQQTISSLTQVQLTLIYPAHFEDVPCQSGVNHIFEG